MSNESIILSMADRLLESVGEERIQHVLELCQLSSIVDVEKTDISAPQRVLYIINRARNSLIRNVIIDLNRRCYQKFILIKGLLYAEDLYPIPERRVFSDVDIIIKRDSFYDVYHALLDMGFKAQFPYSVSYERSKKEHIIFTASVNGFVIVVEVHMSALNPAYYYPDYVNQMFDRAMTYKDTEVLIPCVCDRIIHSFLHFCIHTRDYLLETYIAKETIAFSIRDLLDVALTEEKYPDEVNIDKINDYISRIGAEVDIGVALHVYKLLFPASDMGKRMEHDVKCNKTTIFKTSYYLIERVLNTCSISDFFFGSLLSLIELEKSLYTVNTALDGRSIQSASINGSLYKTADKLHYKALICTDPEDVTDTRAKLYYVSSKRHPIVRMITFQTRGDGLEVSNNGDDSLCIHAKHSIVDARHWELEVSIPLSDIRVVNNCLLVNPIMEYGIVSQNCLFGERWTDIGLWKPVLLFDKPSFSEVHHHE